MGQLLLMTLGMLFAVTASSATSGKREFGIFMGFQYYGPPLSTDTYGRVAAAAKKLPIYTSVCADHNDTGGGAEHRTPGGDPADGGRIVPICDLGDADAAAVRAGIKMLAANGVRVMHYTHTRLAYEPDGRTEKPCCECCEPIEYVEARIKNETRNFPTDGIFSDNTIPTASWLPYYTEISKYARANGAKWFAFNQNCAHATTEKCSADCTRYGHSVQQCADCASPHCSKMGPEWVDLADVHILSESTVGSSSLAPDYKLDLPFTPTDAQMSTFSMVTYNATPTSWKGLIDDARKEGYSKFFVSGAGGGARTSFAALPPWFEEMVDYIAAFNTAERADDGAAAVRPGDTRCNLQGNWTNRPGQHPSKGSDVVHIEIWQPAGSDNFTIRATPWGTTLSQGHMTSDRSGELFMVGGGWKQFTLNQACNRFDSLEWCKFPDCQFPEPAWPPWSPPAPPVPPAPPAHKSCARKGRSGACPLPPWPAAYAMNESTVVQPCNASGYWSYPGVQFGLLSFDWSNAKEVWSQNPDDKTNCSEMLVEQARRIKQSSQNRTRVFVYRNFELALEWIRGQRSAMLDQSKQDFFLRYQTGPKAGEVYDESQFNGLKQFFWNFTNPEAVEFFISEATGPDAIGNVWVDGIFTDDVDGTFQEHGAAARAMGLTAAEQLAIVNANNAAYDKIIEALVAAGGYDWQAFGSEDGTSGLLPSSASNCAATMRKLCAPGNPDRAAARLVSSDGGTDEAVAGFLIARGTHWWLGSGWAGCSDEPKGAHPRSDLDPGTPTTDCAEVTPGVFSRTYANGKATLDCLSYKATLDF